MTDLEVDSEGSSPRTPRDAAVEALLRDLAHAAPESRALGQVELPTPLRELVGRDLARPGERIPEPGAVIAGRYRIESVIGAGGMGVVFAARHVQTEKPVALKWMLLSRVHRTEVERGLALSRFAREARAAGRIRHPNVVDVHDASSDEAAPFLVMERLEGETLRARIERGALAWEEMLLLLLPALHGVAELHRQGIVHRDLKPDNVFLARVPGAATPCAKVLDFGVSLLRSADGTEDSLTGTGAILGTPAYMALEQLRGDGSVDERTDVYALGVVLFEALTGQRPWRGRNAGEYGALLASSRPTRLSSLRPELKGAREAAIMKALEREPGQRHASVTAFIAALEAAARPVALGRRWLFGALALALLVAGFVLHQRSARPTPMAAQQAREPAHPPPTIVRAPHSPGPSASELAVDQDTSGSDAVVAPAHAPPLPPKPLPARALRVKGGPASATEAPLSREAAPAEPQPARKDYATGLRRDDF